MAAITKVSHEPSAIAINESLGAAVATAFRALVGIVTPAAWTAAGLGLHVSYDGSTYVQLMKRDELSATATIDLDEWEIKAADMPTSEAVYIPIDPSLCLGATHIKPRSQTLGSAVTQDAARTVILVFRDIGA